MICFVERYIYIDVLVLEKDGPISTVLDYEISNNFTNTFFFLHNISDNLIHRFPKAQTVIILNIEHASIGREATLGICLVDVRFGAKVSLLDYELLAKRYNVLLLKVFLDIYLEQILVSVDQLIH